MKVSVKDFYVDMDIKSRGMELAIRDNSGKQIGDLVITMTGLTWCEGKTTPAKGIKVTWAEFREWMMSD